MWNLRITVLALSTACIGCSDQQFGSRSRPTAAVPEDVVVEPKTGRLSGSVMINGSTAMPLVTVEVYRINQAGFQVLGSGSIKDGKYVVENLPIGEVQVMVSRMMKRKEDVRYVLPMRRSNKSVVAQARRTPPSNLISSKSGPTVEEIPSLTVNQVKMMDEVEQLYGSVSAPKKIVVNLHAGTNEFDIDLETRKERN